MSLLNRIDYTLKLAPLLRPTTRHLRETLENMNQNFNQAHQSVREVARRFACERLKPRYMDRERTETHVDRDLLRQMGTLGLIAPEIPVSCVVGSAGNFGSNITACSSILSRYP